MIKTFEHKIPFDSRRSFKVCQECGNKIPKWQSTITNENEGILEWKVKPFIGLSSFIRVFLRQQRPEYTLLTIYVNRPFRFIDPFKKSEKIYRDIETQLKEITEKINSRTTEHSRRTG